jgi:hypothetical protein
MSLTNTSGRKARINFGALTTRSPGSRTWTWHDLWINILEIRNTTRNSAPSPQKRGPIRLHILRHPDTGAGFTFCIKVSLRWSWFRIRKWRESPGIEITREYNSSLNNFLTFIIVYLSKVNRKNPSLISTKLIAHYIYATCLPFEINLLCSCAVIWVITFQVKSHLLGYDLRNC